MNLPLRLRALRISRLAIPMRVRFEHAAAERETADPVIVQLSAGSPYAHLAGWGEALARPYVTGETPESVVEDVATIFAPRLASFAPASFFEALEFLETLPQELGGRIITAARTAVELALLDLAGRAFQRRLTEVAGWLGLAGFGAPGCLDTVRYSGITVGRTRAKLAWLLRAQRWYGLRDFKLKAAVDGWEQRLRWAADVLRPAIHRHKATLRVDANGGWSLAEAAEALPLLEECSVCAVEQPLAETHDDDLPFLAERMGLDLIVDESLLTIGDVQRLLGAGGVRVFNIRIAKNGGLLPSLRIARAALGAGRDVQLGCLVGETSILTAAGAAFLQLCPQVRFVEGAFGRFLLREDVVARPLQFGYGGRLRAPRGFGLGIDVSPTLVAKFTIERPRSIEL